MAEGALMAGSGIIVTVEGLDALKRKLGGATEPIGAIVREAGIFAREKTAQYAKPHAADTGGLGRKITLQLSAGAVPLSAMIIPHRPVRALAEKVEEGGNAFVPMKPLTRWARRHGYIGPKESAWHISRLIAQRGTKGVYMFEHAAKDTEGKIKELVGKAAAAIERKWRS
jgi:hypothetical protein